jgi:hypothetical protein
MSLFAINRSCIRKASVLWLAAALLLAQVAIAAHSHAAAGKQDVQTVELRCVFCVAGSHVPSAPSIPDIQLHRAVPTRVDVVVRHVCDIQDLISPRLTRGPPANLSVI